MILSFFDPLRNPLGFFDPLRDCTVVPERIVDTMKLWGYTKVTVCRECKHWADDSDIADGEKRFCSFCLLWSKPDDYCSFAEVIDDAEQRDT